MLKQQPELSKRQRPTELFRACATRLANLILILSRRSGGPSGAEESGKGRGMSLGHRVPRASRAFEGNSFDGKSVNGILILWSWRKSLLRLRMSGKQDARAVQPKGRRFSRGWSSSGLRVLRRRGSACGAGIDAERERPESLSGSFHDRRLGRRSNARPGTGANRRLRLSEKQLLYSVRIQRTSWGGRGNRGAVRRPADRFARCKRRSPQRFDSIDPCGIGSGSGSG